MFGAFAARLAARPPAASWREALLAAVGLICLVVLGAFAIWLVGRRRKAASETGEPSDDELGVFRGLHERGEISHEEFEKIRGLLEKRPQQQLVVPFPKPDEDRAPEPPPDAAGPAQAP